jgi:hypothetical protein
VQWPLLTYGDVIDQDGAPFQVYRTASTRSGPGYHRVWTYHRPDHPRPRKHALVDVCDGHDL